MYPVRLRAVQGNGPKWQGSIVFAPFCSHPNCVWGAPHLWNWALKWKALKKCDYFLSPCKQGVLFSVKMVARNNSTNSCVDDQVTFQGLRSSNIANYWPGMLTAVFSVVIVDLWEHWTLMNAKGKTFPFLAAAAFCKRGPNQREFQRIQLWLKINCSRDFSEQTR